MATILEMTRDMRWNARHNELLAALPRADYERLRHSLEPVDLSLGQVLCEVGIHAACAYFPITSIVSLTQELPNGATAEVAIVGHDGMVGIAHVMGGEPAATRAFVRAAGTAYRIGAAALQQEFESCEALRKILLRCAQSLFTQAAETAVRRGHHTVEQEVCRILLSTADQAGSDNLAMTQELIGDLVGVRRESITMVAGALQSAGLIRYHRGLITLLDRAALAHRARCERRSAQADAVTC